MHQATINLALIGYGYWGEKLLRNFLALPEVNVKSVVDIDSSRLEAAKQNGFTGTLLSDYYSLLIDSSIHGFIIATPALTHFTIALAALKAGKHVLVEKPMTTSLKDAYALRDTALQSDKVLMTDHTFLYSRPVRKIKEIFDSGEAGDLLSVTSHRMHMARRIPDVNVLWDLAPHDISIVNFITGKTPVSVKAIAEKTGAAELENIGTMWLTYPGGVNTEFHFSWVSPEKIRKMVFSGSKLTIVFDDMEEIGKIKLFKVNSHEAGRELPGSMDTETADLNHKEPLREMAEQFLKKINENQYVYLMPADGVEIIKVMDIIHLK
jgi:predicted dehydrogenase